ncbi:gefF [Symbiodinium sp. CCMP2592]|nr:gefF [Symbiodinium sp. CCMP2592]
MWSPAADGFYTFGGHDGVHHAAVWSPAADGFYTFGGSDGSAYVNNLWFYARQANSWTELSPSGTAPSIRADHDAAWSPAADGFYVFGGYDGSSYLNDLWFYGRQANSWTELSPSGTAPSGRSGHAAMWSPAADGFYVFGGKTGSSNVNNDLWFYGRQANSWTELSPSGTAPSARSSSYPVWSPAADGFYVFGGWDGSSPLNDLWFYGRQAGEGHRQISRA